VTAGHEDPEWARQPVPTQPETGYRLGLELASAGDFFAAHEAFEAAWRAAEPEERDFFQGLVHVVVAWYQAGRGNRNGCARQLVKATRRLTPYGPAHRCLDTALLLRDVAVAAEVVTSGSLGLPPLRVRRLQAAEADRLEGPVHADVEPPEAVEEEQ